MPLLSSTLLQMEGNIQSGWEDGPFSTGAGGLHGHHSSECSLPKSQEVSVIIVPHTSATASMDNGSGRMSISHFIQFV